MFNSTFQMSALIATATALCLAGCGKASDDSSAVPTYSMLAMDMQASDLQQTESLSGGGPDGGPSDDPNCHPHLFNRTREVVQLINRHIFKVFGRLTQAIDNHPDQTSGSTLTWTRNLKADAITIQSVLDKTACWFPLWFANHRGRIF